MRFTFRLIFMLLFSAAALFAQTSRMYGQIFHQDGRPAANVTIIVDNNPEIHTQTNAMGVYSIRLNPGKHSIRIGTEAFTVHIFNTSRNRKDFHIP